MTKIKFRKRFIRLARSPLTYVEWLGSTIATALGTVSAIYGLLPAERDKVILWLVGALVFFALINLALITLFNAYKVRYRRGQRTYEAIHRIVEEARNCRNTLTSENCNRAIREICFNHIAKVLGDFFGPTPKITLKYVQNDLLQSMRSGDQFGRLTTPEKVKENEVFEKLVKHPDKFGALYIKDIRDKQEVSQIFGVEGERLGQRAEGKYRTFMAIPLRSSRYQDGPLPVKNTIGMLGFDSMKPGSFEDLEEEDYQALYAIVDILSECVIYWQHNSGANNGESQSGGNGQLQPDSAREQSPSGVL
ncbi:MAG TPA: hypothetical protein VJ385_22515 [Fibrobacteria bacterium]|nr:hypothetical protein [Fibrobacteria bacterium]